MTFSYKYYLLMRRKCMIIYIKIDHVIRYLETVDFGVLNNQEVKLKEKPSLSYNKNINS